MITVAADKYLNDLEKIVPESINLRRFDPDKGFPDHLQGVRALLLRTVTPITDKTIDAVPESVQFIGTASAGTDHIDTDLLDNRGITFADAAGCNARSVAEYVVTGMLMWALHQDIDWTGLTIGIVGVGNAGSELKKLLDRLHIQTKCYDPPRVERNSDFESCSLEEVLNSDILTFHTPLKKSGDYPTRHWLDEVKLQNRHFKLIINTARGGVINEKALLEAHSNGDVDNYIIDVWENEPFFNDSTARNSFLCTPHIAGYSIEAKRRASLMVVHSLCNHFSIPFAKPVFNNRSIKENLTALETDRLTLGEVLQQIHPMSDYQDMMKKLIGTIPRKKGPAFNALRVNHPLRHEYSSISLPGKLKDRFPVLTALGFRFSDCP